jgi:catechol 2,3-dioxygenase-like lactoylglutathione lyase family enzyme
MTQGIDHVVIAVRDLAVAAEDYRRLGFIVTPGGEHAGGATHNALVSFADGAYFELIAFLQPDREQDHKWWAKLARGEGAVDYALLSDGLDAEAERLRDAGVEIDGPRDGGRLRPDGQRLAWRTIGLTAGDVPLPFVIEDLTPHDLRVPPGTATEHALGVSGIAGLTILVPDLERAADPYAALLGASGEPTSTSNAGAARARRFAFGEHWIELAEPEPSASALLTHIRDRGAAPFEITLAGAGPGPLPLAQTHGARIRFDQ